MAANLLPGEEGAGLLNNNLTGYKQEKRRWSKTKICCIVCAVLVLIVLIVIGSFFVYISTYTVDTGDVNMWEDYLSADKSKFESMTGSYELVAFDEHYQTYLEAMGIPFFVVPLILSGKEALNITVDEKANNCSIITITDWMTRESSFQFGETFSMKYGKGSMSGIMFNICEKISKTEIFCKSEERDKGWEFESTLYFSYGGLMNKRNFINKNIVTKKYYKKEGVETKDNRFMKTTAASSDTEHEWLEFKEEDDNWLNNDEEW